MSASRKICLVTEIKNLPADGARKIHAKFHSMITNNPLTNSGPSLLKIDGEQLTHPSVESS